MNQEVAIAMLQTLGCEVHAVENGQLAFDRLENERFDLVLMDCQMPIMDGFEATRRIREREATAGPGGKPGKRLPIVALTAHAMQGDRQECLAAGMDDYLTKPFTKNEMRRLLGKWIGTSSTAPPPPEAVVVEESVEPASQEMPGGPNPKQPWRDGDSTPQPNAGPTPARRATDAAPQAGPASAASLDPAALESLAGLEQAGNPDLVARVVEAYLSSSSKLAAEVRAGAAAGDPKRMAAAAHTLKSSSAQVGAMKLSMLCKEIEALGRSGSVDGVAKLVDEASGELESVHEGLAAQSFGANDV